MLNTHVTATSILPAVKIPVSVETVSIADFEASDSLVDVVYRGLAPGDSIPDDKRYHINDTGTEHTEHLHARVIQMVTNSLRYRVHDTHVDGFRFDLARSGRVR